MAESLEDPDVRAQYLTYVFVGAGYAGLEGLAELQDFAADIIDLYPRCRLQGMRWMLVEARDRIMPEIPPTLADFAARELRGRGIEIRIEHDGRGGHRHRHPALDRRGRPQPDRRLDGRRQAAPGRRAPRPAASATTGA